MTLPQIHPCHTVGFIDSGWGGITILDRAKELLPDIRTLMVADHAYMPYGTKSEDVIRSRVRAMIAFLRTHGADVIVIACNTASVSGLSAYRDAYPDIPIIGVVPVLKTAAELTHTRSIAMFATMKTVESPYVQALIDRYAGMCRVTKIGSPILASLIEEGDTTSDALRTELVRMTSEFPSDTDVIVLGCTHYPYVTPIIRSIVGPSIAILDSSGAVSRHIGRILSAITKKPYPDNSRLWTTGDPSVRTQTLRRLTGRSEIVEFASIE